MTVCSLFAGIGGLDLGLERAGFKVVCQVENDPFCQSVLAKHWPNVKRLGDIRDVSGSDIGKVDLLAGGFPCQDISFAGHGAGLAGPRSGLWFEYARLIREINPGWVLVENVPALRSRGLGTVLRDLARLGYDSEWVCLPACAFGASHVRRRLFIVAYPTSKRPWHGQAQVYPSQPSQSYPTALWGSDEEDRQAFTSWGTHRWEDEPNLARVADGVPTRLDSNRYRVLGNAVCPPVAYCLGRWIMNAQRRLESRANDE